MLPGKSSPGGCSSFVITVTDVTGASPPTVPGGLSGVLLESGGLRDYPAAAAPASGGTGSMFGDFGVSGIQVCGALPTLRRPSRVLHGAGFENMCVDDVVRAARRATAVCVCVCVQDTAFFLLCIHITCSHARDTTFHACSAVEYCTWQ